MRRIPLRDLATLGLALGGLMTMVTGVFFLISLAGSTPRLLAVAFSLSVGLTVSSAAAFLLSAMRHPHRHRVDPSGNGHQDPDG